MALCICGLNEPQIKNRILSLQLVICNWETNQLVMWKQWFWCMVVWIFGCEILWYKGLTVLTEDKFLHKRTHAVQTQGFQGSAVFYIRTEPLWMRREWSEIFKLLIEKTKQTNKKAIIIYPEKFSFRSEGEIETFSGKQKSREFVASGLATGEILREIL